MYDSNYDEYFEATKDAVINQMDEGSNAKQNVVISMGLVSLGLAAFLGYNYSSEIDIFKNEMMKSSSIQN